MKITKHYISQIAKSWTESTLAEKILLIFLILCQIYYSFRYILQYGSVLSSPGYQLTPEGFQDAKYILAALFFVVLAILAVKDRGLSNIVKSIIHSKLLLLSALFFLYFSISLLKFGTDPNNFAFTQTIKMSFVVPFVLLVPFIIRRDHWVRLAKTFLVLSLAYHVIFELVMIILYLTTSRLPNLIFANPIMTLPRYGGGWDDPNSFAAFTILLTVIWLVLRPLQNKLADYLGLTLLILLNLLAYSLTGIAGLALAIVLLFILRKISLVKALFTGLLVSIFALIHYLSGYWTLLLEAKQNSSVGHLSTSGPEATAATGNTASAHATFLGAGLQKFIDPVIGVFGTPVFHENIFVQLYYNFGIVGLALLFSVFALSLYWCILGYRKFKSGDYRRSLFVVFGVYIFTFFVTNVGIPHLQVFPINLFVWIILGLVVLILQENLIRE